MDSLARGADEREVPLVSSTAALVAGGLTGLLALTGMVRLTEGAFSGGMSRFAWVVVLAAMLPWVIYVAVRARHGRLSRRGLAVVLVLVVAGFAAVWLAVLGPVVALVCSLAAFVVVWVSDWPLRPARGEDRFVRIEELQREDET
jgi:hypothetical protein